VAIESDAKTQELAAIIEEIRNRVRARHPEGEVRGIGTALPDLLPVLHARDAAEAKVASIGSVNPRPAGFINDLIQSTKRSVARLLGWFVRDQVEFNRSALQSMGATLDALNEVNRAFAAVGGRLEELQKENAALRSEAAEIKDTHLHWQKWHTDWERKLIQTELHFMRNVGELQAAAEARAATADANYRRSAASQHREFSAAVEKAVADVHARFWADFQSVRMEFEKLIHNELRVIRQKAFASAGAAPMNSVSTASNAPAIDYAGFADRFRGGEEYVRKNLRIYRPYFEGKSAVIDIGCGRGEFLEMMREAGVPARGVELDEESVALCRSKGLDVEHADAFEFFDREPDASLDGVFASQVIEHLPPERIPELVKLCASKLKSGGLLAFETPNPECLAIFATHFYLDPTHTRPVPPGLMVFYLEEYGFGGIEVHRLSPAVESMPSLAELPAAFREAFFGGLDYGVLARKL
jgi:O-antigen chain-terminating methyltransferase